MSVQDAIAHPALPGRARRFRVRYFLVRILLVALLLALVALLPGAQGGQDQLRYHEGDISRERVVAPYDFRIEKDEAVLRREQTLAEKSVPPLYFVDPRASSYMLGRFGAFQDSVLQVVADPTLRTTERVDRLRGLGVPLSLETARVLASPSRARQMLVLLGTWLQAIYRDGVVDQKSNDLVVSRELGGQTFRTINLQSGESEQPHAASLLYDRRSALAALQQRAGLTFGQDPLTLRAISEIGTPFVQANVTFSG